MPKSLLEIYGGITKNFPPEPKQRKMAAENAHRERERERKGDLHAKNAINR